MGVVPIRKRHMKLVMVSLTLTLLAFRRLNSLQRAVVMSVPRLNIQPSSQPTSQAVRTSVNQSAILPARQPDYQSGSLLVKEERGAPDAGHNQRWTVVDPGDNAQVPALEIYIVSAMHHTFSSRIPAAKTLGQSSHFSRAWTKTSQLEFEDAISVETNSDLFTITLTGYRYQGVGTNVTFVCCVSGDEAVSGAGSPRLISAQARYNRGKGGLGTMYYAEYTCNVTSHQPRFVYLGKDGCTDDLLQGLEIEYIPLRSDHTSHQDAESTVTLAICPSVLYGNLPPDRLVEWFEFQRLVGVQRVHIFYHKNHVDTRVLDVLRHYEQDGLLTTKPFSLALKTGEVTRNFSMEYRKTTMTQLWMDSFVALNDCRNRLAAFTFILTMDLDELLVPQAPHVTLNDVFQKASAECPEVSFFYSDSYMHVSEWGATYNKSSLYHLQHLDRNTDNKLWSGNWVGKSSPKTFYRPERISIALVHNDHPKPGYKSYYLAEKYARLHHYRACKRYKNGTDCHILPRVASRDILPFQTQWEKCVSGVKSKLNL